MLRRCLSMLVPVLLMTGAAFAQSPTRPLVQLRLDGALRASGGSIEVEAGAMVKGERRRLRVATFLGPQTTGAELVALLAKRMEAASFDVTVAGGQTPDAAASLFLDDALYLHLRLAEGLTATVTTCTGPPASVRVVPPSKDGGSEFDLTVAAGWYSPQTKTHSSETLRVELPAGTPPPGVAERLLRAAQEAKWVADRPTGDVWRPIKKMDGGVIQGLSLSFVVPAGGVRLDVEL